MKNAIHRVGDLLGDRYRIDGSLGQGGMQEVYKAFDNLLSRDVALKTPKNPSAEKRFQRSAVVSARINHDNVAKTLDYFEDDGRYYLIEEYIDGCDLSKLLKGYVPQLDPYVVARIMHHMAKGVAASHHVGVVHRDLKPSNIMVGGAASLFSLKITDFGIAKMAQIEIEDAVQRDEEGITNSQTALGALPYMAPEMIEDLRGASLPVDIWALGAIAYELLVGKKPFGIGYGAVPKILSANLPAIPRTMTQNPQYALCGDIFKVIQNCIQKDVTLRPNADTVVSACEELCYNLGPREFGIIESFNFDRHGYIRADSGDKVFYHLESIFSTVRPAVGMRVWFSRYPGSPFQRAFPVVVATTVGSAETTH